VSVNNTRANRKPQGDAHDRTITITLLRASYGAPGEQRADGNGESELLVDHVALNCRSDFNH
jgi:hypothetical protein